MKQNKPEFIWEQETGKATCILETKNGKFIGEAYCHPEDIDMKSEIVGCEIALCRATIYSLQHLKNNIIKPSLQAVRQLYFSMNRSKHFNPKSYEIKMVQSQIRNWTTDLATVNTMIARERKNLKDYVDTKETFYQTVRQQRKGQK